MILRNLSTMDQTVSDGDAKKTVAPLGLVAVSTEVGSELLASAPRVWSSEQALIPPAPPAG